MVELMPWMHDQEDSLTDKQDFEYSVVSLAFDELWFVDCHE